MSFFIHEWNTENKIIHEWNTDSEFILRIKHRFIIYSSNQTQIHNLFFESNTDSEFIHEWNAETLFCEFNKRGLKTGILYTIYSRKKIATVKIVS